MENNKQNTNKTVQTSVPDAKKKKTKYSLTVTTSTALIIVAIVILNFIMVVLGDRISLTMDLTKDSILTFSDTTEKILSELDMDVKIMSLIPASDESREVIQIDEILKKYDRSSDKISYSKVDTKRNPAMLTRYQLEGKALESDYHIIFESKRMYTVVNIQDLLAKYFHNNQNIILTGALKAEQYFSSAINKVTKGSDIHAYVLSGHGEKFNAENFRKQILPGSGIDFKDLSLASEDIPENANLIIIASPETDYSEAEIAKIDSYMRDGGDIQLIVDYITPVLPNFYAYLKEWGVTLENGIAADAGLSNHSESPISIIADIAQNEITSPMGISGNNIVFLLARPISVKETINTTCNVIATTSDEGYIKTDIQSGIDSFEEGDIKGKSNLAVVLTRQNSVDNVSHMSIIGTSFFFGEYNSKDFSILSRTGNRSLVTGLVNYMTEQPTIIVAPKDIYQGEFVISRMSIYAYTIVTVVLIPLAILALGLIIWLKRRHS